MLVVAEKRGEDSPQRHRAAKPQPNSTSREKRTRTSQFFWCVDKGKSGDAVASLGFFALGLLRQGPAPGPGKFQNLRVMERRGLVKVEDAKPNHPQTARRTGEFL